MDHSDSDCLMVVVMTHGKEGILAARDTFYTINNLWSCFSPLHCKSLAGKPKLFFIDVGESHVFL